MCWRKWQRRGEKSPLYQGMLTEADRRRRVGLLTEEEQKAFDWFKAGYTARWTEETMLLDKRTAKQLFSSVYRKLGVKNAPEVTRLYGKEPLNPEDVPDEELR